MPIKRRKRKSRKTSEDFDYGTLPIKEFLKVGIMYDDNSFSKSAGLRAELSPKWIPVFIKVIKICSVISILSFLLSVYFIIKLPEPLVILSYPDGNVQCALPDLDINTGKFKQRSTSDSLLCDRLDKYSNGG